MMRAWLVLLAALVLALPARAGEVLVWHTMRGAEEQALQEVVARFEAEGEHTVRLVALSFGAYDAKLETAIPRGNGPDVFIAAHGNLGKWTAMGLLQPLPEAPVGHRDIAIQALTLDDQVWGQPLAFKSLLLLVDPERVPADARPHTTEALVALARRLTRVEDGVEQYGLVYPVATPYHHAAFMHGFGAVALDADGRPALDTPEQVAALRFVAHALERYLVFGAEDPRFRVPYGDPAFERLDAREKDRIADDLYVQWVAWQAGQEEAADERGGVVLGAHGVDDVVAVEAERGRRVVRARRATVVGKPKARAAAKKR